MWLIVFRNANGFCNAGSSQIRLGVFFSARLGLFFLVFSTFHDLSASEEYCSREGLHSVAHNNKFATDISSSNQLLLSRPVLTFELWLRLRLIMGNFIQWQQVSSDQGASAVCSVTKPPALWERRGGRVHTSYCFQLCLWLPSTRRWLTQIIKIRSESWGAEQRKLGLLNIELTCYHVTRPAMNSMQRSQRIFLDVDWFYC